MLDLGEGIVDGDPIQLTTLLNSGALVKSHGFEVALIYIHTKVHGRVTTSWQA